MDELFIVLPDGRNVEIKPVDKEKFYYITYPYLWNHDTEDCCGKAILFPQKAFIDALETIDIFCPFCKDTVAKAIELTQEQLDIRVNKMRERHNQFYNMVNMDMGKSN